jgi:hypothetical protein
MTIEYTLDKQYRSQGDGVTAGANRPPRVARLLALAYRFEELVRTGAVKDYAELARLGHITRARVTQIMNLLSLAPEIQEYLLWLPSERTGEPTERDLRRIAGELGWDRQRAMFREHKEKPPRKPPAARSASSSNQSFTE